MRFSKSVLFKVVAFAIVCLIATVALAVRLSNQRLFKKEVPYEAVFDNAQGVLQGDSVKIAGVDVGTVDGTRIESGRAVVEFSVDDNVELTDDTIAAIRWRNVLGQRFLYLYPGTGARMPAEGRIRVDHTRDAGDIGEFLNDLGPILQAIDPAKANAFLDAVNTALADNEVTARRLIDNGAVLAGELGRMDKQISAVVGSSDRILNVYAEQSALIGQILDHLNNVGGHLQASTHDLDTVITAFADVQRQLDGLLKRNRSNIDTDISDLHGVAHTLATNKENLARTLCTLPLGTAGYFETSSWGEWFNVRIVEVMVKDSNNHVLVDQKEKKRGRRADPAVFGCDGATFKGKPYGPAPGAGGGNQPPVPGTGGLPGNGNEQTGGVNDLLPFMLREGGKNA
jgi:phospholipid/cholesterol/gamma-HCH transport system substrate-binding protein